MTLSPPILMSRRAVVAAGLASTLLTTRAYASAPLDVLIRTGMVRGKLEDDVRVFSGIPFAETTGGANRFGPPIPKKAWKGVFDATRRSFWPPQAGPYIDRKAASPQSEDCLQANIWAPTTPGPHPVFVWIFGGGNYGGSNHQVSGKKFAKAGVVFVALNYRIGAAGYLELGAIDPARRGSGNSAPRDLALGIKWVHDNIAAFGGDPRDMTVGGQSAGGKNTPSMMALPATNRLFRRAIVMSGGGDFSNTLDQADAFAAQFVAKLGGKERLWTAPLEQLMDAQEAMMAECDVSMPWRPVVDGVFYTKKPVDLLRGGVAKHISVLAGSTQDECAINPIFAPLLPDGAPTANAEKLIAKGINNLPHTRIAEFIGKYAEAYPAMPANMRIIQMGAAIEYGIPTMHVAEAQAGVGAPTYFYRWDIKKASGRMKGYAPHAADIISVFYDDSDAAFKQRANLGPAELAVADRMFDTWLNFIKTGTPGTRLGPWPRFDLGSRTTMMITDTPAAVRDPLAVERRIWDGVI